MTLYYN